MNKYEDPILKYNSEGDGGDLIQPMCCNVGFAVVVAVYVALVVADALGIVNWMAVANGVASVNAIAESC